MSIRNREEFDRVLNSLDVDFQKFTIDYEPDDWFAINIRFPIKTENRFVVTNNIFLHDQAIRYTVY